MNPRDLENYFPAETMLGYDLGVGVTTIYKFKDNKEYFILGDYRDTGALSPTAGARFNEEDKNIYNSIEEAFKRKRLGIVNLDAGKIGKTIYYSINETQQWARLTFVQTINVDLFAKDFQKQHIDSMQDEAKRQASVANFFQQLDNTVKNVKGKFNSNEERINAAKIAYKNIY